MLSGGKKDIAKERQQIGQATVKVHGNRRFPDECEQLLTILFHVIKQWNRAAERARRQRRHESSNAKNIAPVNDRGRVPSPAASPVTNISRADMPRCIRPRHASSMPAAASEKAMLPLSNSGISRYEGLMASSTQPIAAARQPQAARRNTHTPQMPMQARMAAPIRAMLVFTPSSANVGRKT